MISESGTLIPLDQKPFSEETSFQKLLEDYPELLSGELIDSSNPRRWILVRREVGVSDGTSLSDRWALDHLFLDQDAIPTLVEVKRAENNEVRRQVVGQILDYAANAVKHWPPDFMRMRFEERMRAIGNDPDQELSSRLGIDLDAIEKYWEDVEANLRNKKIRMLVVADHIPHELRRIAEFLNEQMNPSTFLALELRHFAGQGIKTLVPVVFGQTEQARQEKKTSRQRPPSLSISDLIIRIESKFGSEIGNIVQSIVNWALDNQFHVRTTSQNLYFGIGNQDGVLIEPFSIDTSGKLWGIFSELKPPFNSKESRLAVREKLSAVPGIKLSNGTAFASTFIRDLTPASVSGLEEFLTWIRKELRKRENTVPAS